MWLLFKNFIDGKIWTEVRQHHGQMWTVNQRLWLLERFFLCLHIDSYNGGAEKVLPYQEMKTEISYLCKAHSTNVPKGPPQCVRVSNERIHAQPSVQKLHGWPASKLRHSPLSFGQRICISPLALYLQAFYLWCSGLLMCKLASWTPWLPRSHPVFRMWLQRWNNHTIMLQLQCTSSNHKNNNFLLPPTNART